MAKDTQLRTEILITCNAQNTDAEIKNIKKSVKALDSQIEMLGKEYEKLLKSGQGDSKRAKQIQSEIKWLTNLRSSLNSFVRESIKGSERIEKAVNNLAGISTRELRRARRAAQQFRDSLSANDPQFAEANENLRKIQQQIDKNTGAVNKHGSAWKTTIKNMMAYVSIFGALNLVKSKLEEITSLNLKFSQQLADVRKVSGLANEDIKQLGNDLAKIDSRTSLQGLMTTAYSGAKLGFGNYGIEGLVQFTKAANVAAVSLGEELGEDALPALSKIVENMGLIKKYGVEQSMLKTASAMFKLSSTSTATSNNIVEFAKRLTAMSRVAGVTTDQLLALGSASDSMYLAPEVAATAFTKLFSSLQTNHNLIEKTLQIPKGTINDLFSSGKAMDAIVLVFQKMHDLGNMNALKPIFKDLGSDGARLMNVMTAMAKNVDVLQTHLKTSAEAFKEGTAATKEYNIQQETAEGLMERANNLWQKAVMNPEQVDVVQEFAKAWYDVSKSLTTSQFFMWSLRTAISMLVVAIKTLVSLLPALMIGFGTAGLVSVIVRLAQGFKAMSLSITSVATAWKNASSTMKYTWLGLIATAITEVIFLMTEWVGSMQAVKKEFLGFKSVIKETTSGIEAQVSMLNRYRKAIDSAAKGTNERNAAIANFNKQYGSYYKKLLNEKSTVQDVARAYAEVNKNLRNKMLLEGMQKDFQRNVQPRIGWAAERLQAFTDASKDFVRTNKGAGGTGLASTHNADWLRGFTEDRVNKGQTTNAIFAQAIKQVFGNRTKGEMARWSSGAEFGDMPKNFQTTTDKVAVAMWHYISQERSRWYNEQMTYQTWKPYRKNIDAELNRQAEEDKPGTLDNDAPDKEAIKAAKAAAREAAARARKHKKWLQDQLKANQDEVKSFTKAIDAYYTLQEQAIQEMYMSGKMTEQEMNRYVSLMKSKHDMLAAQGRFAIVGDKNNFDELRKQMGAGFDQFDYSAESNKLLGIIQKANPAATGKLIRNFESQLGTAPENSMMNNIRSKGVDNMKSESDRRLNLFKASDAYLSSKQYVENAARELDDQLAQAGITDVSLRSGSQEAGGSGKIVRTKEEVNPKTGEKELVVLGTPEAGLREDFRKQGTANYDVDTTDAKSLRNWLDRLVSVDGKGVLRKDALGTEYLDSSNLKDWTAYFPAIKNMLLGIGDDADAMIKQLFSYLMQWEDKTVEAQKQRKDYEQKLLDERWSRSSSGKAYDDFDREMDVTSKVQSIYGRGETGAFLNTSEMARNNGFADNITDDPEVLKIEAQMRKMQDKLALAQQTSKDEQVIRDAEKAAQDAELAYAEKINEQIKARIDLLQQWVDPIQEFSEQVGDAFVKMGENAEEGQQAIKDATQNMVKTFAKMTIDMIAQQLKMETQRALFHNRMKKGEKEYQEGLTDTNEKGHKGIFKSLASFFKKKKKDTDKANKDEKKQTQTAQKEQTDIVETSNKTQEKVVTDVKSKMVNISKKSDQESSQAKTEAAATDAATTGAETQGNIFAGIASGAAKIIGKLGFWGIPLIAVIQGLLMGLLNSALSKLFGGKGGSASTTNTKLVSGMLTYDSGNVEAFRGAIDQKTYPVVGNDGKVYAAKPTDSLVTGLLTEPVATTVGGVPSLIAERGPEMIIGRETTQALMMARPDIISEIVRFDKNHSGRTYKAYDGGNVADVVGNAGGAAVSAYSDPQTQAGMANIVATMQAMMPAMQAFVRQLQQPINAKIGMYGKDGIYENVRKASKFMAGK